MNPATRALVEAARRLEGSSDTAQLDCELLLADAYGIDRDRLLLKPPATPPPERFWEMVERRLAGEPVAYITGRRAFWDIELHVGPGVLVPRPDSEVLIESAIAHFAGTSRPLQILDLGTGPGTLLLAALDIWPMASGLGVDVSPRALEYAAANSARLGFDSRVEWRAGNWADGIEEVFDLVLANPPYIRDDEQLGSGVREFEPGEALFAGGDGLDAYRALAPQLGRLLGEGGLAAVEIGHDQARAAIELLACDGLFARVANDLGQRPRGVLLTH